MSQRELKIAILGLTPSDGLALSSIVRLTSAQLDYRWVFSDQFSADLLIADPNHRDFDAFVTRAKVDGRPLCVCLLSAGKKNTTDMRSISSPLRSYEVLALLKSFEAEYQSRHAASEAALSIPNPSNGNGETFDHVLRLVSALQKSADNASDELMVIYDGQPALRVCMSEGRFCTVDGNRLLASDGTKILAYLGNLHHPVVVEKYRHSVKHRTSDLLWLPLSSLYWHLGTRLLTTELIPGLNNEMSFKLKNWPDFGSTGSDPRFLKLAAFMVRRSLNLAELRSLTQQSVQVIIAFINACALCQLVLPTDDSGQRVVIDLQRVLAEKKHEQGLHGVFNAIRSVFRLRA